MKCVHCGGTIIFHAAFYPHPATRKCMMCGREHKGNGMTEETKRCKKCKKELALNPENFRPDKRCRDGFEARCKDCRGTGEQTGRKLKTEPQRKEKLPITKATPEEILVGLRRGMAAEIVAMINEKYGL